LTSTQTEAVTVTNSSPPYTENRKITTEGYKGNEEEEALGYSFGVLFQRKNRNKLMLIK